MKKDETDYSLYLVTDSTPVILGTKDIVEVVEKALKGGVTIVQYRDKTSDTGVLISVAKRLHDVTKKYNVPLLINDRVDVALAVGCEGVHVGQDDMNATIARKLLGPDAIIGVSASSAEEALKACEDGAADYLGLGAVFGTPTKKDTKSIIGPEGVRGILEAIDKRGYLMKTVCIGGINASNIQMVSFKAAASKKKLDGFAVVSALMAAQDPEEASRQLLALMNGAPPFKHHVGVVERYVGDGKELVDLVPSIIGAVTTATPLTHNMTNLVVQNIAANVAIAVGASPIMANYGEEAADLAKLGGALVINMGTVTPDGLANYVQALKAYNAAGGPVIFDPVGAGATSVRRAAVKTILSAGYVDIIKGNEGEITTVYGQSDSDIQQQRGVDSSSTLSPAQKAAMVRSLAQREKNVVVMTGKTDFISDGTRTLAVDNGHEYLSMITGSGCVLGTTISAMAAAHRGDKLAAVLAGLLHFEIAAEMAAVRQDVLGPGTFVPAFIDELYKVRRATVSGDLRWLSIAKVRRVEA